MIGFYLSEMSEDSPPYGGTSQGELINNDIRSDPRENNVDMAESSDFDSESDDDYEVVDRRKLKRSISMFPSHDSQSLSENKRQKKIDELTLKITAVDSSIKLAQTNPVLLGRDINRALISSKGPIKSVTKCRDGGILVTASDEFQYKILSGMIKLGSFDVKVTKPSKQAYGIQGVISGVPLDTPDVDILSALSKNKVTSVQRITKKINGVESKTFSVKLSFSGTELPDFP